MPEITGTFTVSPMTDENKITILMMQNDDLRAEIALLRAERDAYEGGISDALHAMKIDRQLREEAEAERDASRATAQRALGAAAEANARLEDVRKAALNSAEAMARCPEVAALIFAAEACHHTSPPHPSHDLLSAALAAFAQETKP